MRFELFENQRIFVFWTRQISLGIIVYCRGGDLNSGTPAGQDLKSCAFGHLATPAFLYSQKFLKSSFPYSSLNWSKYGMKDRVSELFKACPKRSGPSMRNGENLLGLEFFFEVCEFVLQFIDGGL